MNIVSASKRMVGKYTYLFFICDDGVERTASQLAEVVGVHKSTIIGRFAHYGICPLVTKQSRILPEEHREHSMKDRPVVKEKPCVLTKRNGDIIPPNGKYDALIKEPTGRTIKPHKKHTPPFTNDFSVLKAKRILQRFNARAVAKGFAPDPLMLVKRNDLS